MTRGRAAGAAGAPSTDRSTGPLGIVLVNYGSAHLLAANVRRADDYGRDVRVVVVDNFSAPDERRTVQRIGDARGWDVVPLDDNRGFGAATNVGVARARELGCVTFLCLNPDARADPEVVRALHAHSLREPESLISPVIVDSEGNQVFRGSALSLTDGRIRGHRPDRRPLPESEDWLTGACLVVHSRMWDRIGGFDERYFLYWEDVDLSHRASRAGGVTVVRRDLTVVHDEGGTQGRRRGRAKSDLYYRYNCRNRLAFAAAHLGRREMLRWLVRTPAVSWEILTRGGRRQLVQSPRPALAAIRGSLAGAGIVLAALARRGTAS